MKLVTEEPRLRQFELVIVDRYHTMGKAVGWKGYWIREHLERVSADYVYGMYKAWNNFCTISEIIKAGSYQAFRTYFYLLKSLGLVRVKGTKKGLRGFPRVYYELVPGKVLDPGWIRPFQLVYPSTDWTLKHPEEKRRLKKKAREKRTAARSGTINHR